MVNTPSKKCPDLPYVDTDTNEAKRELNIAVYYHGIMSVNINLCSGIKNICRVCNIIPQLGLLSLLGLYGL